MITNILTGNLFQISLFRENGSHTQTHSNNARECLTDIHISSLIQTLSLCYKNTHMFFKGKGNIIKYINYNIYLYIMYIIYYIYIICEKNLYQLPNITQTESTSNIRKWCVCVPKIPEKWNFEIHLHLTVYTTEHYIDFKSISSIFFEMLKRISQWTTISYKDFTFSVLK